MSDKMKIIDERQSCDTMDVVMTWNNSEMSQRQQKMSIINVRHNENTRWKRKEKKNKDRKKQRSGASYSERVRAKWFCCAFKLGFVLLICKASLIFKSNLEWPF